MKQLVANKRYWNYWSSKWTVVDFFIPTFLCSMWKQSEQIECFLFYLSPHHSSFCLILCSISLNPFPEPCGKRTPLKSMRKQIGKYFFVSLEVARTEPHVSLPPSKSTFFANQPSCRFPTLQCAFLPHCIFLLFFSFHFFAPLSSVNFLIVVLLIVSWLQIIVLSIIYLVYLKVEKKKRQKLFLWLFIIVWNHCCCCVLFCYSCCC